MTNHPTYGRFTLDYIERTGPVDRVGLVLTDPGTLDAQQDADAADIIAAAKALSGRGDEPNDWTITTPGGDTAEVVFDAHP